MLTSYARTGVTALVTLVMTPVLIAGLGLEAFGIWVIVGSLAVFRDLLGFGLQSAAPKFVAESAALGDPKRLRTSIATSFWLLAIAGVLVLVLGLALVAAFPHLFHVSPELRAPAQLLLLVAVIELAIGMPMNAFAGTLIGLQRFDLLNANIAVVVLAQAAGWAIVLALGGGLVPLGVVTAALALAGHIWLYLIARRLVPGLSISPRRAERALVKPFASLSAWYGLEDLAFIVSTRIDVLVVALVLGAGAAGLYAVGQKLATALGQLVQPISNLFFPHASELSAKRDKAGLRRSVLTGTRILFAVAAPLALTLAILAGPIIETWVGSGFGASVAVAALLSGAVSIWVVSDTGLMILLGVGKARIPAIIRASEAGLNLGLSVLLVHLIGLEGVALATLIAAIVANLLVLFPYMCRQFGLRLRDLGGSLIASHAPAAALAVVVGWLVTRAEPSGLLALAAAAAAIAGTYLAVLAVTGLDRAERRALLARVRQLGSRPQTPQA